MKKITIYLLTFISVAALCTSCDDVLNIDPTDRYSASTVWGSTDAVDAYVFGFYAIAQDNCEIGHANATTYNDCYSDIMKSGSWNQYNQTYNTALLQESTFTSADAGPFECWSSHYTRIRRQNEFLRDAPSYVSTFGEEFINSRMGEIRFCRAFTYYLLIRVYGGVVLRTTVDGPEANDKARSTEAESWALVIEDLQYAAENLPESWPSQRGRATKNAAYALLARAALFAEEWEIAIDAANNCDAALDPSYSNIFNDVTSTENIFSVEYSASDGVTHRSDVFFRPSGDNNYHTSTVYSTLVPTSEYVDEFEYLDGSDFSWSTCGDDPYAGRDPRLAASILYNGSKWEDRTIQTYAGGEDGFAEFEKSGTVSSTCTGYYLRKFITENATTWETLGSSHFFPLLRVSEVYLNKAEALAQSDWAANKVEALAALNDVRARAGMPTKDASSLDEFMALIRRERIVELGGEGFRYWDLRRWRLAIDVIAGQQAHGVYITNSPTTDAEGNEVDNFTYEQVEVDAETTRIFYEQFYAFSIPLSERTSNLLFGDNNPGW